MVDTWNGEMPISRAAGGRMEKSIDCPMPTHPRQMKRRRKAKRLSADTVHRSASAGVATSGVTDTSRGVSAVARKTPVATPGGSA